MSLPPERRSIQHLPTPDTAMGKIPQERKPKSGNFLIIFGPPGSGKTIVGEYLESAYGYTFFDADMYRPVAEKERLTRGEPSTQESRDQRFTDLIPKIEELKEEHARLAIITWLPVRYHQLYEQTFPGAVFIFMEAPERERVDRIGRRKTHFIKPEYNIQLTKTWGNPLISNHITIVNDGSMKDLHNKVDSLMNKLSGENQQR